MPQAQLDRFGSVEEPLQDEAIAVAGEDGPPSDAVVVADEMGEANGTIAIAVHQVNYTLEYDGGDEQPLIHLFGRDEGGDAVTVTVRGFTPYFYAPTDSIAPDDLDDSAILDTEDGYRSIRDEELTRIYARTPRDVGTIRDRFTHFEADVPFPSRFLIDKGIQSGVEVPHRERNGHVVVHESEVVPTEMHVEPRVHMMDIEVDDRSGFPEDGEEPIISIAAHDSFRNEYVVWLYLAPDGNGHVPTELDDHELLDASASVDIRIFEDEAAMIADYLGYVEETDFDIWSGWNFDDFDAPYLLDRMERLDRGTDHDLSIERLSRVDEVWRDNWRGPNVKGRVVFDLLYGYRRTQFSELDSYRLDAVGEAELGTRKEVYTGSIGDLWENDPERLLEYNLRDVELCVEIDRKQEVIAFWNEVRTFVGCKLEDAPTPGDAVDVYVLHKVHGEFVLPSKGQVEGEQYEGGAVFDPITGVREMVSVLDLKSLYPMCMVTVNASPETKVDPEAYDGDTYRAPNGTHFRKEPDGIIREMVDELLTEREQKKARRNEHEPSTSAYERFDQQQAAVKVIMNCFTPDTDVLTPSGIRNIRDLEVGDRVYSLNPDTMTMEIKPIIETHAYPDYRGEIVDIQTSTVDFRVTPNHRMLVRGHDNNGMTDDAWGFVEAGELSDDRQYELPNGWSYDHGGDLSTVDLTTLVDAAHEVWVRPSVNEHTFTAELGWTPPLVEKQDLGMEGYVFTAEEFAEYRSYIETVCERSFVRSEADRTWIPRTFEGDDFLALVAWYITEGDVHTAALPSLGRRCRGSSSKARIAQHELAIPDGGEDDHYTRIGHLLDRMGFDYDVDGRSYQFAPGMLGEYLRSACGKHSDEKQIPEFVFACSERQKRSFVQHVAGGRQADTWRFSTASRQLRDDVIRLSAELGFSAHYGCHDGGWQIDCTEAQKHTFRPNRSATRSAAGDGVYCVSVADNQTLLAGRNGTFQPVGNSVYGVLGWDRFRLYDREMGAAVTATGREVLEFTEEEAATLDKEVIYGDTDSIMTSVGQDITKEDAIERSFELEEHINASYDDFALETLNADTHRFQIEFEKLFRRFFQAGKKKRYAGHVVWYEGKNVDDVDITGFEYQRSDIAQITKEVQREVIDLIVTGEDLDADLEQVKTYLEQVIESFLEGDIDVDAIGIPGGIGKRLDNYETDTAHVRGAKYANTLLGTNFNRGSKPKRYYLKGVHPQYFREIETRDGLDPRRDPVYGAFKTDPDVICVEFAHQIPDTFEIDYEKMLDKTLKGPISRIVEALDMSWDEIKSGQEQTGLSQF